MYLREAEKKNNRLLRRIANAISFQTGMMLLCTAAIISVFYKPKSLDEGFPLAEFFFFLALIQLFATFVIRPALSRKELFEDQQSDSEQ